MKQSLVATRSGAAFKKHQKILQCMRRYPEGVTPKVISFDTSINVNTIKAILPKITGIKKTMRGYYKVVERGDGSIPNASDSLCDWNFHNCILSCKMRDFPSHNISSSHSFGLINCEFIISKKGVATLRVATDNPLNVSSICMVYGFFRELISRHSDGYYDMKDVYIRTIEFNKDYSNLRLDGLRCLTIDSLVQQFKIYQKKLGMRIEHKTKVNFTVENIVDMLTNNPNSLESNLKLTAQKEQLDRLTKATANNTEILMRIISNLKGGQ